MIMETKKEGVAILESEKKKLHVKKHKKKQVITE